MLGSDKTPALKSRGSGFLTRVDSMDLGDVPSTVSVFVVETPSANNVGTPEVCGRNTPWKQCWFPRSRSQHFLLHVRFDASKRLLVKRKTNFDALIKYF